MNSPLTFYIFFHKDLFEQNTADFTEEERQKWFSWVALNEKIPKQFPKWLPPSSLLCEYTMPKYNPMYQMMNFYQNSGFLHLYWNSHLINTRYIGFGQYDMKYDANEFRQIIRTLENDGGDKMIAAYTYPFGHLFDCLTPAQWEVHFLEPYNQYYHMNHTLNDLSKVPLALLHTFIIPKWFFLHMMPFVEKSIPSILSALQFETRHLAGTLERVFALCISCAILENKFKTMIKVNGISHEEHQHDEDALRGIVKGYGKNSG
jgi:hypothetical protein